jgi:hypothetical protein
MAARGCGDARQTNGVYWELGIGPGGRPVEDFLIDPPIPVPDDIVIPKRGQLWHQDPSSGVWHLIDRVGMGKTPAGPGYWNVADFVEEVRELGLSRRLSSALDFSRLTKDSRILLVHDRAYVEDGYYCNGECPKQGKDYHDPFYDGVCAGFWWNDIEGGEDVEGAPIGTVKRTMPSFTYTGGRRPELAPRPTYRAAFFASFPASQLVVVKGEQSAQRLQRVAAAGIPAAEVDE